MGQSDGKASFQYDLFATPRGQAYAQGDVIQLTHEEQVQQVEAWLTKHRDLGVAPSEPYKLSNVDQDSDTESFIVFAQNETFTYKTGSFRFYNGRLHSISWGKPPAVVQSGTVSYGTTEEIEAYLNWDPKLPWITPDVLNNVHVEFEVTGYSQTALGGLELDYVMLNSAETMKALGVPADWQNTTPTTFSRRIKPRDEQIKFRQEAESYIAQHGRKRCPKSVGCNY